MVLMGHYSSIEYKWAYLYEIGDFSSVFVNNGFCVIQQLLLSLNPILSGAAMENIHLMNNGRFNPGLACSTWLWFTRQEKDKYSLF